jgi:hypothetical protein
MLYRTGAKLGLPHEGGTSIDAVWEKDAEENIQN